jgi:hypothetical protein
MTKKKDKKQNALKHGAYSRELMLPGERIADYEELRQAHYDEWVPEGVTELCLVDELTALRWKKRRMAQYDQILLRKRNTQVRQNNEVYRHRRNLRNLGARFTEAANTEEAEEILAPLSPFYKEIIENGVPREKCQDATQWHQEVGKYLSNLKSEDPVEGGPHLFAAIVNPDLIEMEISRSDRLDEAIDRKIKRLMQVKTAKQIFPSMRKNARPEPKLINAPAGADGQPGAISENEPRPAEIVVSLKSQQETSAIAAKDDVLVERTRIAESGSASVSSEGAEKLYSGSAHVKMDFFAKRVPTTVEELNSFSAFCNRMNSNASSNPTSSPGPASN